MAARRRRPPPGARMWPKGNARISACEKVTRTPIRSSRRRYYVAPVSDYLEEVRAFRARREARLAAETGWFTLVDRIWLEPGETALPIGTAVVDGARVRLRVPAELGVTRAGAAVAGEIEV